SGTKHPRKPPLSPRFCSRSSSSTGVRRRTTRIRTPWEKIRKRLRWLRSGERVKPRCGFGSTCSGSFPNERQGRDTTDAFAGRSHRSLWFSFRVSNHSYNLRKELFFDAMNARPPVIDLFHRLFQLELRLGHRFLDTLRYRLEIRF